MSAIILLDAAPKGPVLSPSQISTYDLCKRKWALKYIGGYPDPPGPSAKLGTEVHKELENWLRSAKPPNLKTRAGKIADRMIRHLPQPGTGAVERRFWFTTPRGHYYTGFIDWSGFFQDLFVILDHKTTSSFEYAKTPESLYNDVQAIIYAVAGFAGFGVEELGLFWGYGCTKGRDADTRPVKTRVHLPVVTEKFEAVIEPVAAEIVEYKKQRPHPLSFPPTPAACDAFGGCPYRNNPCHVTDTERFSAIMDPNQQPTIAQRMEAYPAAGPMSGMTAAPSYALPVQGQLTFQPAPSGFAPQQMFQPLQQGGYGLQQAFQPPQQYAPPQQGQLPAPLYAPGTQTPTQPAVPMPPPQQAYAPQQAFLPPQAPQQAFQPPQAPQAPQQVGYAASGAAPGGFLPPQAPQSAPQQPPQQAYSPEQAPNPPESGQAAPSVPEKKSGRGRKAKAAAASPTGDVQTSATTPTEAVPSRGRGRPPGAKNKDKAEAFFDREEMIFLRGSSEMIASPHWNGDPAMLLDAGNKLLAAYTQRFGALDE